MIKTKTFHPSRIGCPSIPGTIKGIMMSIPGVSEVKVRYEDRSCDVTFDDEKTSEQEIIKTIGKEMGLAMGLEQNALLQAGSQSKDARAEGERQRKRSPGRAVWARDDGARKDGSAAESCPM